MKNYVRFASVKILGNTGLRSESSHCKISVYDTWFSVVDQLTAPSVSPPSLNCCFPWTLISYATGLVTVLPLKQIYHDQNVWHLWRIRQPLNGFTEPLITCCIVILRHSQKLNSSPFMEPTYTLSCLKKSTSLVPTPNRMSPVHNSTDSLFDIHFNIILKFSYLK